MRLALTISLLSLCAVSGNSYAADTQTPTQAESAGGDSLILGMGLAYVPEYAGADKSRLVPLPFFERKWSNGVFFSSSGGIGYQTSVDGVGMSASVTYGGGRKDHKQNVFSGSDALKGMGDIDNAAKAVLGLSYKLGDIGLSASTTQSLSHREQGGTYTLGASTPLYSNSTDQVRLGASAVYGDNKHMQTYFGVTERQSMYSGYKTYQAKSGFENVTLGVNWDHAIDKNWAMRSAIGVSHLTGDAADSPLTKRKTTPMLMTSVAYKF
jgi:outer membrane scaffolding protein for murein synthesis (MipA/OmpV family)